MKIQPKLLVITAVAVALLAGAGAVAASALRQPDRADFSRLDTERQIVDMSMNVYGPVFDGFSTDYGNGFTEERSADEQSALKAGYVETLDRDRRINTDRLDAMRSSVALKQPAVKKAFDSFDQRYFAVIDYYEQHAVNIASITESVAGECDMNNKLNVAKSTFAADYAKAADACLKSLASAKSASSGPSKKLLSDVETLIKKRRDAFNEATNKEGFEKNVAQMLALITLLDINTELKGIQEAYQTAVKTEYTKLVNDANESNEAFKKALKPFIAEEGKRA